MVAFDSRLPVVHWQPGQHPERDLALYRELLSHPLSWCPELRAVVVAQHALVRQVLADVDAYRAESPLGPPFGRGKSVGVQVLLRRLPRDPVDDRGRGVWQRLTSADEVERHAAWMRQHAAALVDRMRDAGRVDLGTHFARPYAAAVLNELCGFPPEDGLIFDMYCAAAGILVDPTASESDQLVAAPLLTEAYEHIAEMAPAGGAHALFLARLTAGRTLPNLVLAAVDVMLQAGAWDDARAADPAEREQLIAAALEEALRAHSPHAGPYRVTTRDVLLSGATLPAGTSLYLAVGAANRDAAVFAGADDVDVQRPNASDHLAFGHGPHRCPAVHLTRTVVIVAVDALLALPAVCVVDDVDADSLVISWHVDR
jgi:cytochrome P450